MSDQLLVTANFNEEKQKIIRNRLQDDVAGIEFLASASEKERKKLLKQADILFVFTPDREFRDDEFDLLQNARFMQLTSAGADHIPYHRIPEHITIASNAGAYAKPIAEHTLAMSLALAKRLMEEHRNMKKGEFNQYNRSNLALFDSTVGILGFGGIGKAAARLFRACGAHIFAMNTSGKSDEPVDFIGTMDDLKTILESSDIVVISLPLNNHTRGMIGKRQLEWMKPGGILINVARGEIVNQKDLYEYLEQHPDFKAGLESWWVEPVRHGKFELDYPFLELPNVLASPHNSAIVTGIMEHGIGEAAKNIQKYLRGESFKGKITRQDYI
jgi:glycerate dehydrogenase